MKTLKIEKKQQKANILKNRVVYLNSGIEKILT